MDTILLFAMAVLSCVGFVHAVTWVAVRHASRRDSVYRIIPVGGEGKNPGQQLALMFTCLQWEANPSGQVYVLYDMGLDEQGVRDCRELVRDTGAIFVQTPQELDDFFHGRLLEQQSE